MYSHLVFLVVTYDTAVLFRLEQRISEVGERMIPEASDSRNRNHAA